MNNEEAIKFLDEHFLSTGEAADYLGITRRALTSLVSRGKIKQIEKGGVKLYLRTEIEQRKAAQSDLREKYRPYDEKDGGE